MPHRNYEIIATLGPATLTPAIWEKLLAAGATAFRLNTSHLSIPQLEVWLEQLQTFQTRHQIPVVFDLQGSKWRLGEFPAFELATNTSVVLIHNTQSEQPGILPVPHPDFFKAAQAFSSERVTGTGNHDILLNDGKIVLRQKSILADQMTARVLLGGMISSNKGITFEASGYRTESINTKDKTIVAMTQSMPLFRYAISYVKDALEMERYRSLLGNSTYLIAKLERQSALDEALEIAALADEVWLCRGDLGAEIGWIAMAEQVDQFTHSLRQITKPVMMAGQVLEHTTENVTPTRSEICYLYDTLQRGYAGIVLSDETAIGHHPLESCQAAALFKTDSPWVISED